MKRKIMEMGGKSLILTLPLEWAHNNGVKKGDEVDVSVRGKDVLVSCVKTSERKKLKIDASNHYFTKNYVPYFYHKGFDEIEVTYSDPKVYGIIKKNVADLMGFEIINQGEKRCLIKNISVEIEEEFDSVLKRAFHLINEMASSGYEAAEKKEFERLKEIAVLEKMNNKLTDFCKRILNKKGYPEFEKTTFFYVIVRDLEKIGDEYRDVLLNIAARKKVEKEVIDYFKEINDYFNLFYELFYKFDTRKAEKFYEKKAELLKKGYALINGKKDPTVMFHLVNLVVLTYDLYGPYFSMMIE